MKEDNFLKVAKQAALEAGKIISKYYGKDLRKNLKYTDKSDFTTKVDLEAEKLIVSILSRNFPDHNIIAEEKTNINNNSEYTWFIDPLDGTISYSAGLPFFAVSIGLFKNNQPVIGVIFDVYSNNLYFGEKGKGAYLNNKQISVSKRADLESALVDLDYGHRVRRPKKLEKYINKLVLKIGYPYSLGPATTILGLVGQGALDGYIVTAWRWDLAAGVVIVREAGGEVTDFEGNEPDWTKERWDILASNGLIHDAILEALKTSGI